MLFVTICLVCPGGSFTCRVVSDQRCIPFDYLCDGVDDCGDGEDESQDVCGGEWSI